MYTSFRFGVRFKRMKNYNNNINERKTRNDGWISKNAQKLKKKLKTRRFPKCTYEETMGILFGGGSFPECDPWAPIKKKYCSTKNILWKILFYGLFVVLCITKMDRSISSLPSPPKKKKINKSWPFSSKNYFFLFVVLYEQKLNNS